MDNFSKEYIFKNGTVLNKALSVQFINGTDSHKKYGDYVVIDPIWEDQEGMLKNYSEGINTYGQVKAKIIVDDRFSASQKAEMLDIGFNTNEIYSISMVD